MDALLIPHVAIIGGGCAGLSAAAALARAGVRTTVFDSSHQLGGRARGIHWQGLTLDNGQHILLGAYARTLELLHLCGVAPDHGLMRLPLKLDMANEFSLSCPQYLPAPLHILAGLLQARGLSISERLAAVHFMASLKLRNFHLPADMPLQQLLEKQPARLTQMLWEPLCLAAVNTPISEASAQVFLNVLRDSFARKKSDSDLLLPRADLSTLIAEPAARFIAQHGGYIKLNSAITSIQAHDDTLQLQDRYATVGRFSHVVVATSPFRVAELLHDLPNMHALIDTCTALEYQPIYTIYLQYPANTRLPDAMCGLANQLGQWVFDRGQLYGQEGLIAVVISAEGSHQNMPQETLATAVHHELQSAFPSIRQVAPLWHKVIAEKRATFACRANMKRPLHATPHQRLWLAGDYVSTGDSLQDYPATIEGAIRSGFQVAENILKSL
nr:hydroxysqualene dehydroxylase HpnE [Methylobacillus rhizosphaerae]